MTMMSSMVAPTPITLSENIAAKDIISYRERLESLKMVGDQYRVDLLLPIEPTSKSSGVPDINGLFQDPVFQLN